MRLKRLLYFFILFLSSLPVFAQLSEYGLSIGALGSRYTVHETRPNDDLIVRQGSVFAGGTFGMLGQFGAAKEQPVNYLKLYSYFRMELNYCYCGGNIELLKKVKDRYSISSQQYRLHQLNLKTLYTGRLRKFIFMLGPTASYNVDRQLVKNYGNYSASAYKINKYALGFEMGIGLKVNQFTLSSRYHMVLSEFSKKTKTINTAYNAYQFRLVLSYFFLENHTGKNWGSIYWK